MAITSPAALLSGGLTGGVTDALKDIAPKSSATSGDASTGPVNNAGSQSFAQSSPFSVGGGSASSAATSAAGVLPGGNNTLLIVAIIAGALILALTLRQSSK